MIFHPVDILLYYFCKSYFPFHIFGCIRTLLEVVQISELHCFMAILDIGLQDLVFYFNQKTRNTVWFLDCLIYQKNLSQYNDIHIH